MIISIDTEKDSKEAMLKAAALLQDLAGISPTIVNEEPASELQLEEGILGMFDEADKPAPTTDTSKIIPYE